MIFVLTQYWLTLDTSPPSPPKKVYLGAVNNLFDDLRSCQRVHFELPVQAAEDNYGYLVSVFLKV